MKIKSLKFICKRLFDIVFGLLGILLSLPVFIVISLFIKIESRGSVFFKQARLGKNLEPFFIYKFRSMIEGAEQMEAGIFNEENDSRVTKVGNFLRNTSLDEIPQLFNIIRGDMSFVGPRPPVTYELGDLNQLTQEFIDRFRMKPGLTGLAQVSGRNELSWDEKVKYDNRYIELFEKYGILIDIKLLFLTVVKIIKNEGRHEMPENVERDRKRIDKR